MRQGEIDCRHVEEGTQHEDGQIEHEYRYAEEDCPLQPTLFCGHLTRPSRVVATIRNGRARARTSSHHDMAARHSR